MKKLSLDEVPIRSGCGYPAPFDLPCRDHRDTDVAEYPEIDLRSLPEGYTHKDGRPYPESGG